jgi:ABC-type antimicrobial peptide transport system permease subunit
MRPDEASRRDQQKGAPATLSATLPTSTAWRARRAGFFSAARLSLLRATHSRWLLLIIALGILVAVVLICTVPLYNTLVSDLQLQNAITRADLVQRNMQVSVRSTGVNQSVGQQIASEVQSEADHYLTRFTAPHLTAYVTSTPFLMFQHVDLAKRRVDGGATIRLHAFDYAELRPYLHFIQGASPQTLPQKASAGKRVQVMITREMADAEGLAVGQTVVLAADLDANVAATVSGIVEPINENDPFWNGFTFRAVQSTSEFVPTVYPVFTTTDSFYSALSGAQGIDGDLDMIQTWIYRTNPNQITADNMADVANEVITFRSQLSGALGDRFGVTTYGGLDQIIGNVQQQLSLIALPLYVIAAQIVGLALLFVAAMATLLIEQQGQEIATLKSRGTSGLQLLGIFTTQSTLLGLLAALAGPFLAVALALLLIRWFLPGATAAGASAGGATSAITSTYLAHTAQPGLVLVPALIGAVLGVAVVTVAALQTARLDVLAFRRELARPSRAPFWRRAYLDVGLALLCAVGYLELDQFGGTQTRLALGTHANSPLLLLTPALLLLAGGLLLLRLIPLVAWLGARLANRGRGLTTLLAFTQIERTPGRYARMTLLLVLAVGLGLFALTFDATLAQNVQDRTSYAVGADVRLIIDKSIGKEQADSYLAHLKTLPGVADATPLYRTNGRTPVDLGNRPVDILGLDATSFSGIANPRSWRADYASQSLPDLMTQLAAHRAPDPAAAGTAARPLWALVSTTLAQQLRLHVGDHFHLSISGILLSPPEFVVGAILRAFPTLYPTSASGSFLVMNERDLEGTIVARSDANVIRNKPIGPNEFWLRTSSSATPHQQQALLQALDRQQSDILPTSVESYQEDLRVAQDNAINGGMRGLLLIGALTAALLAVLGTLVQTVLAARQRTTQFAIFRTLGMANHQLSGLLLGEQAVVYFFGLLGGTLLGLLLTTATVPFLAFSDATVDPATVGVPAYLLRANGSSIGLFYGVLLLAFVLALVIAARYAATIGLGKALRLGED